MSFEAWFQSFHPEISTRSIAAVLELAADGATVPFMARYRKEKTGNLNEVSIQAILENKEKWDQIISRQKFILEEIERQKKLTPELKQQILSTFKLELLNDLFLPYKQERKTKAAIAKEAGLEPLADWIWNCGHGTESPLEGQTLELWAWTFRNEAKQINDAAAAIAGANDILIEKLSQIQELRQLVRSRYFEQGVVRTQKAEKAKPHSKFEGYFDFHEAIPSLMQPQNSHRYLAMKRGWNEEELRLTVEGPPDNPEFENDLVRTFETTACTVPDSPGAEILLKAARLAFKVHVFLSIENEIHKALREVADSAAIHVFSENLRKLLLASPFGAKAVLGIDPGVRTGCKLAVVDDSGKYIASTVMHLHSENERVKSKPLLVEIIKVGNITAVAVGNGTAGRETEKFVRESLKENSIQIPVIMVSEAGASVYSASEVAREEFPELDVTVRGAISIARRLQDPLAELVKIDPKSIGVGQYQHDVSPNSLKRSLGQVVESCVNQVGVNLNTASYHLLTYISGIGPSLAKAMVEYRNQNGLFKSRNELLEISRFSKKAFQQAAGFLKIPDAENPLDNTGVHPEKYAVLEAYAKKNQRSVKDFLGVGAKVIKSDPVFKEEIGVFTFEDVIKELEKPGLDPRSEFVPIQFRDDIYELKDLKPGLICPGVVTNVTNFGAFVDIGVHQDGLVHISQLTDKFVKDPHEVVKPGDRVKVRILEVNVEKTQISLSMKNLVEKELLASKPRPKPVSKVAHSGHTGHAARAAHTGHNSHSGGHHASQSHNQKRDRLASGQNAGQNRGPRKPKEVFNNAFASLAALKNQLKPK